MRRLLTVVLLSLFSTTFLHAYSTPSILATRSILEDGSMNRQAVKAMLLNDISNLSGEVENAVSSKTYAIHDQMGSLASNTPMPHPPEVTAKLTQFQNFLRITVQKFDAFKAMQNNLVEDIEELEGGISMDMVAEDFEDYLEEVDYILEKLPETTESTPQEPWSYRGALSKQFFN